MLPYYQGNLAARYLRRGRCERKYTWRLREDRSGHAGCRVITLRKVFPEEAEQEVIRLNAKHQNGGVLHDSHRHKGFNLVNAI